MKINLNLRPVCVWTEDHIKGHVTCCIIALILLRRLQMRTKDAGQELTINKIQKGLREAYLGMLITDKTEGSVVLTVFSGMMIYIKEKDIYYRKPLIKGNKNCLENRNYYYLID